MFRFFFFGEINGSLSLIFMWAHYVPVLFKLNAPDLYCKIYLYFTYAGFNSFPWIYTVSSIDRFFAVKYPRKFEFRKSFKFQILSLGIIYVFIYLIDLSYIFYEHRYELE